MENKQRETECTAGAYRIVVQNGEKVLWDTGKVLSREQTFIIYEGEAFSSQRNIPMGGYCLGQLRRKSKCIRMV